MHTADQLARMDAESLRSLASHLIAEVTQTRHDIVQIRHDNTLKQLKIDQLTHEMAILKRWKFAAQSERLDPAQRRLFDETLDADLEAIGLEIEALKNVERSTPPKGTPRRAPLPADLPRTEVQHEPDNTVCACGCALKRIGEDLSEKLDYEPGVFSVERHIRGKWACARCEILIQAPVSPHVIDKGIPTTGLLAQVLVAKYLDHLPLYRQEGIFGRAGVAIPRSTLAHRKFFVNGVTEVGCLAHARRKFFDLWDSHKTPVAEEALQFYAAIYDIERTAQSLDVDQRTRLRTLKTKPIMDTFHTWLVLQRQKATDGTNIARRSITA